MKNHQNTQSLGIIVGNRDIFPDQLAEEGGKEVIKTVKNLGFRIVTLFSEESGKGTVQTREDAKECARLFKGNAEDIEGIVVVLPNFGDEKSIAEALRLSDLDVPVLVHAFPDEIGKMDRTHRRDSFCGKFSVCNNLRQYGIPFTNTCHHVEPPTSEDFRTDMRFFGRVCRVVKGVRGARLGSIGTRPGPFRTVRYSEKILEGGGVSVECIGLTEVLGRSKELDKGNPQVQRMLDQMGKWFLMDSGMPRETIVKTAKLAATILEWCEHDNLDAVSFQCWPVVEKYYGIAPCAAMSLVSESGVPSACESDVMGSLSMYALQLASGRPAMLVDLNNNYGDDPNKFVVFHCSNFPRSIFEEKPKMGYHEMQNMYGACSGRIAPGPATLLRLSTEDRKGRIRAYVAEGEFTTDELETFGGYGVVKVEELQSLLRYIADEGFEHHVAMVHGHVADILEEAIGKYIGWEIYQHALPKR